jgi:hypothetical protein
MPILKIKMRASLKLFWSWPQRATLCLFLNPEPLPISTYDSKARPPVFAYDLVGKNGNTRSSRHEVARSRISRRCLHVV